MAAQMKALCLDPRDGGCAHLLTLRLLRFLVFWLQSVGVGLRLLVVDGVLAVHLARRAH